MFVTDTLRHARGGFSDEFHSPNDCQLQYLISLEVIPSLGLAKAHGLDSVVEHVVERSPGIMARHTVPPLLALPLRETGR
jgi:hypothetical protein